MLRRMRWSRFWIGFVALSIGPIPGGTEALIIGIVTSIFWVPSAFKHLKPGLKNVSETRDTLDEPFIVKKPSGGFSMRILFFHQSLGVGGAERQAFLLADQLQRRGHHVTIAALHILDQNWKWFCNADSEKIQLLFSNTPRGVLDAFSQLIRAATKLKTILKRERIELVYSTQWSISNFVAWMATRGMPHTVLVWSIRGSGVKTAIPYRRDWKILLMSRLCQWVSSSVPLVIFNSDIGLSNYQAKGYRFPQTVVIHNGIDVDRFRPDPKAGGRIRTEWGARGNERLIGLVGRMAPVKGHSTFIRAAALLSEERTDVRFVCVGNGPVSYRNQLQRLSKEVGLTDRLLWIGDRRDMRAVYNALDVVCSPSYSEGFNNVIAEAMACGVPCVVTDVGDPVNIVGDLGIVVPPGDPRILAKELRTMLQRCNIIDSFLLRERIVQRFSVEAMVDATESELSETYRSMVPGRWKRSRTWMHQE